MLNIIALISFVFVAGFTYYNYKQTHTRAAIVESWVNIIIGFSVNYVANIMILPMIGGHLTAENNFALGWIYTAISILRQFTIRRWFEKRIHHLAEWITGQVKPTIAPKTKSS